MAVGQIIFFIADTQTFYIPLCVSALILVSLAMPRKLIFPPIVESW